MIQTVGTIDVTGAGWYSIDVTNFINDEMGDKIVSFKFSDDATMERIVKVDSKENTNPAYLVFQ
ncbi:CBM96 family carbohydrate-binding protein [Gracilibacillus sp. D59]|uniref:CBM96 family carbohydrate-binding protein n=1 Tax=Gracilibacillus sp. D59 TaxID=3457434 RepID=UPI003FCE8D2B